ncbi:MAG: TonB-dependent receptor [Candidatus Aminicenantes bacterium]|nr:TonB-dependent receptor [Candidatus Aminicenantes bacterium]
MTTKKWLLFFLLACAAAAAGFTADKKEQDNAEKNNRKQNYYRIKKNEVVVVTATMTAKALKNCANTVNVVKKSDVDTSSANNALDILDYLPGIFVNRSGDFGRADVVIRGLGQNCRQVAVLVDGKPEKMGLFGCAVSHSFPLDNVERIEVVKGPASVLYGGEALGGAINIITRLPEKKSETDLSASYGSFNTQQYNLKHGGSLDTFKYFFTFDKRQSSGHVENSDYSGHSFTGKLVYDLASKTRITLQGKYFDGEKHEPGTIDNPVTGFWNDYRRGSLSLSLNRQWKKNELAVKMYRNYGTHRFSDGWDSRDFTNGAVLRFTTRGIKNSELTIGGDIRFFGGRTFTWPKGKWNKNEGALFVQNETFLNDKWIFSAGLRLQFDSLYGREWCPQMGLLFQAAADTTFRGVIGKGFRSPQLNELYMFPPANPELEPERVWNYEIGVEQKIGGRAVLKGSLFYMKGSNMIRTIGNDFPPPLFIFSNTGEFSFFGIETELDAPVTRFLSSRISYSYINYGNYTRGKPGQKVDFSLRFGKKKFFALLRGQYISDYYADDLSKNPISSYFLLDSRLIFPVTENLDLILDVNNLFDKDYCIFGEFPGLSAGLYRMPGRNFQVGFRFRP